MRASSNGKYDSACPPESSHHVITNGSRALHEQLRLGHSAGENPRGNSFGKGGESLARACDTTLTMLYYFHTLCSHRVVFWAVGGGDAQ